MVGHAVKTDLAGSEGSAATGWPQSQHLPQVASIPTRLTADMGRGADAAQQALDQVIGRWQRRGYWVAYRDVHLVQLLRRDALEGVLTGGILAAFCTIAVLMLVRSTRRRWHIVSLTATVDGRVITHHQRATHPPPE
jgi:hypothetical protein